jgi:DNA-binding transcriptional LysR family regulator
MNLTARLKPNHLQLLLKISETGKLQLAASAAGMSQPAASRILSDIESHVGAALFERRPKGMVATPVGTAFVRHARVILGELRNLEVEVDDLNIGSAGEVRVGSVTGPAVGCLVPAIQAVKTSAPGLKVTLEIGPSAQLVRGLEAERLDFVIARLPATYDSRDFHLTPARNEVVSLVVRHDHPLAARENVRLSDLAEFEWVIQERGNPIRQAVETAFHSAGVSAPANITNSSSLLVVLAMLARSDAVAPQSKEVANLLIGAGIRSELATIALDELITVYPYYIIQNRSQELHPAAARVLNEILSRL